MSTTTAIDDENDHSLPVTPEPTEEPSAPLPQLPPPSSTTATSETEPRSPSPTVIELILDLAGAKKKDQPTAVDPGPWRRIDQPTEHLVVNSTTDSANKSTSSSSSSSKPSIIDQYRSKSSDSAILTAPVKASAIFHPLSATTTPASSTAHQRHLPAHKPPPPPASMHLFTPFMPNLQNEHHAHSELDLAHHHQHKLQQRHSLTGGSSNPSSLSNSPQQSSTLSSLLSTRSNTHDTNTVVAARSRAASSGSISISATKPNSSISPGQTPPTSPPSATTNFLANLLGRRPSKPHAHATASSNMDITGFGSHSPAFQPSSAPSSTPAPLTTASSTTTSSQPAVSKSTRLQRQDSRSSEDSIDVDWHGDAIPDGSFWNFGSSSGPEKKKTTTPASSGGGFFSTLFGIRRDSSPSATAAANNASNTNQSKQPPSGSNTSSSRSSTPSPTAPPVRRISIQEAQNRGLLQDFHTVFTEGTSDLVTLDQLRTLIKATPSRYSLSVWGQVYSMSKHGVSRTRFFDVTAGLPCSLVIMKDMNRSVFGGLASQPFTQKCTPGYYGSGECFVFKIQNSSESSTTMPSSKDKTSTSSSTTTAPSPSPSPSLSSSVQIYRWRGVDDYFMITGDTYIAMGGGSAYAWQLDSNFRFGTSGPCSTFESPQLAATKSFEINELEVWAPIHDQLDLEIEEANALLHPMK